jgi:nucleoid-associated protein YgaU
MPVVHFVDELDLMLGRALTALPQTTFASPEAQVSAASAGDGTDSLLVLLRQAKTMLQQYRIRSNGTAGERPFADNDCSNGGDTS